MSQGRKCGLRGPTVVAAARAAAPTFFAWRQRRRRLSGQAAPSVSVSAHRRRRPERLRDRIRAIFHRISRGSRGARPSLPRLVSRDVLIGKELSSMDNKKDAKLRSELLSFNIALEYTTYIVSSSGQASGHAQRHFESMFRVKWLIDTELYQEARFWASVLDDLMEDFMEELPRVVFPDKVAYVQSRAVERITRFLFGMELALRPVISAATLDRANWGALRALDLGGDGTRAEFDRSAGISKALREARKLASRRKRMNKFARKWHGSSEWVLSMGWNQMLADWQRDWNDEWGSPTDGAGRPMDMDRALQNARFC